MDFRRYVGAVRRRVYLLLACIVVVLGASVALALVTTPTYESKARVIVTSAQAETTDAYAGGLLSEQRAATYVEVVESGLVTQRVVDALDGAAGTLDADDLREHVTGRVVEASSVLEITVEDDDATRAQLLAQTYADELVAVASEIETPDGSNEPPTKITVIDLAQVNPDAVSPNMLLHVGGGLFLGLLLGLGLVAVRELLDVSISSPEDVQAITDAPVLGTIAQESGFSRHRTIADLDHHAPRVEAFRVLRTNVQFLDVDSDQRVIVVTSAVKEEGKTATAVDLALTLAKAGGRVALVDGDLRRPRVAEVFDFDGSAGVTTVLLGKVPLADALWHHEPSGLDVLASGVVPPNAAELLQTQSMSTLLAELRQRFDVVVIDAPPLLPVTDAALLAARADAVLLVVRHGRTTRDQVASAVDRLAQVDVGIGGIVLNRVPTSRRGSGTYGYYGSYTPDSAAGRRRSRSRRA